MPEDKQIIKRKVVPFVFNQQNLNSLPNLVVSLSESKERIEQLKEFVQEVMVKGVDYGLVDGFSKPTLLKPGAEKLCDVFGFSKTVAVVNRIEHWETGIFAYEVKMTLIRKENGVIEAEGLGSCNSKERGCIPGSRPIYHRKHNTEDGKEASINRRCVVSNSC